MRKRDGAGAVWRVLILLFLTFISSQLTLKRLHNVFTTSHDWSVRRLWDVWNKSRDDVNYDVVKTLHEAITLKSHCNIFTMSKRLFNLLFEAAIFSIFVHWDRVRSFTAKYQPRIIGEVTLILNLHKRRFNVDIWLKSNSTYVHWSWQNNTETTKFLARIFTRQWIDNRTELCSQEKSLYYFFTETPLYKTKTKL